MRDWRMRNYNYGYENPQRKVIKKRAHEMIESVAPTAPPRKIKQAKSWNRILRRLGIFVNG